MKIVAVGLVFGVMLALAAGLMWGLPRLKAANSADEVHSSFIAALEVHDQQGALDLVAVESQSELAQQMVTFATMRQIGITPLRGPNGLGALTQVRALPIVEAELGHVGISIWSFSNRTLCYATNLRLSAGQWHVRNWSTTPCPLSA